MIRGTNTSSGSSSSCRWSDEKSPWSADGQLVDPNFGTGVVKVTPAHDPNDYATGAATGWNRSTS